MMHFWIFSFNRGEFLRHCVTSIEQCAPYAHIHIFDDDSTDPITQTILMELQERHSVVRPNKQGEQTKHGGLYANMQAAFEMSADQDLVCFLQDDMQLARPVLVEEVERIRAFLSAQKRPCFIQTAFQKKPQKGIRYSADQRVYYIDRHRKSVGTYYSDICLFSPGALRSVGWQFVTRETANEHQAQQKLEQMAYLRDPFVAWLPNVPAYRGKKATIALRWAQRIRKSGYFPIRIMSEAETHAFLARPDTVLPLAEEFLQVEQGEVQKPWIYYPIQGSFWLKHLNSIELKLRKFGCLFR